MSSKRVARFRDFFVQHGNIFAVDASDTRIYQRAFLDKASNRSEGCESPCQDSAWLAVSAQSVTAISYHDGVIYGVGDKGKLFSQQLANMNLTSVWMKFCMQGYAQAVAVGSGELGDRIYVVGRDQKVYFRPLSLESKWEQLSAKHFTAIAVHRDRLFGVGTDMDIYVADVMDADGKWENIKGKASALAVDEENKMLYVMGLDYAIYGKALADIDSMLASRWQRIMQMPSISDNQFTDVSPQQSTSSDASWKLLCVSDTHGRHREFDIDQWKRLNADVLIHAGDLTDRGTEAEVDAIAQFFEDLLVAGVTKHIVAIAGNHDGILQENISDEGVGRCAKGSLRSVCTYLQDESVKVCDIDFHGSPWQPEFEGHAPHCRAFTLSRGEEINAKWNLISNETDVLIVHGPPYGCRDRAKGSQHVGCKELIDAIGRVRPRVVIFGHIHECHGCSRLNDISGTLLVNAASMQRGRAMRPPIIIELPKDRALPAQWVQMKADTLED